MYFILRSASIKYVNTKAYKITFESTKNLDSHVSFTTFDFAVHSNNIIPDCILKTSFFFVNSNKLIFLVYKF